MAKKLQWEKYQVGAWARKGTHSYDVHGPFGKFEIQPPISTDRSSRYVLRWADPSNLHGGLNVTGKWETVGSYVSPKGAKDAAEIYLAGIQAQRRAAGRK